MSGPKAAGAGGDALGRIIGELRRRIEATAAGEPLDAEATLAELLRLEKLTSLLRDTALHSFGEFEQRVQELSLVRGVGELFASAFELDRLCAALLQLLENALRSSYGLLYLYELGDDRLELAARAGPELGPADLELSSRVARLALGAPESVRIEDVGQLSEVAAIGSASDLASFLACPLECQGETLGVIAIAEPEPGRIGEHCERVLRPIADLAAMAIRNARLCEAQLAHQRDLEALVEQRSREVNEARTALSRQERVAALGKLAASISHEVNNPLSFLLSNLERAAEYAEGLQSDELGELIQETREGADRLRSVGEELRSFAQGVAGTTDVADLNQLVETALHLLQAEAKDRISFERRFGKLPKVRCQCHQITQVLLDLLQNAVEAIEATGAVRVTTRSLDDWVEVEIADDGPGLSAEQLTRLFEPFYTTKESGRGLGLSIARDIATAHLGTLEAASTSRGGVFTLRLPAGVPGSPSSPRLPG